MKRRRRRSSAEEGSASAEGSILTQQVSPKRLFLVLSIAVVVGTGVFYLLGGFESNPALELMEAEAAMQVGDFHTAQQLADSVLKQRPDEAGAMFVAGYAAAGLGKPDEAIEYVERIEEASSRNEMVESLYGLAEQASQMNRVAVAEKYLRRVLHHDPDHAQASNMLIGLLASESRTWEAKELIRPLFKSAPMDANYLIFVAPVTMPSADIARFTKLCLESNPDDPLPLLPEANEALRLNNIPLAKEKANKVAAAYPDLLEPQAVLGKTIVAGGSAAEYKKWSEQLPENANTYPDIWFIHGQWAQAQQQHEQAARCYWEATLRDPNHGPAHVQLSQVLIALGKPDQAEPFANRGAKLAKLQTLLEELKIAKRPDAIQPVAELLIDLGRPWEAFGWSNLALRQNSQLGWAKKAAQQAGLFLSGEPFTLSAKQPAKELDLSAYPAPTGMQAEQ